LIGYSGIELLGLRKQEGARIYRYAVGCYALGGELHAQDDGAVGVAREGRAAV